MAGVLRGAPAGAGGGDGGFVGAVEEIEDAVERGEVGGGAVEEEEEAGSVGGGGGGGGEPDGLEVGVAHAGGAVGEPFGLGAEPEGVIERGDALLGGAEDEGALAGGEGAAEQGREGLFGGHAGEVVEADVGHLFRVVWGG